MDRDTSKISVIVIGGPSGSGESTITNEILKRFSTCSRLITATTRAPRDREQDGRDYVFMSKERFLREIETGNIIEHTYIGNRDTYYGSYRPILEKLINEGKTVIVNPDIVGARYYKEHYGSPTIFIAPESIDILRERIQSRTPEISPEELENRIKTARKEMEEERPFYDYTIINKNDRLEEAVEEVAGIIRKETGIS